MEYYRKNYSLFIIKWFEKKLLLLPRKIYICKTLEISQLLPM